jgi:hypothetical protein
VGDGDGDGWRRRRRWWAKAVVVDGERSEEGRRERR